MDALNINIIKEPRGFIRVLQFIFSICAFATTTNFSTNFSFDVKCNGTNERVTHEVAYPFKLDHEKEVACGKSINFFGDFASDSQFFVAAGVLAMLYSLGSLAFYALNEAIYQANKQIPLADFCVTVAAAVFWLSGSAAWASGLSSLKSVCNPDNLFSFIQVCGEGCSTVFGGNFAGLNISIIFGFLNFFLWTVNLWFLYKETTWFHGTNDAAGETTPGV